MTTNDTKQNESSGGRTRRRPYQSEPLHGDEEQPQQPQQGPGGNLRGRRADQIIMEHLWYTGGAMVIPIPLVDMAAVTVLQLSMLRQLCRLYSVPFSQIQGKALVSTLVSGFSSGWIAGSVGQSLSIIGGLIGTIPSAAAASSMTYAVGKVFHEHLMAGGDLDDFDAESYRSRLRHHHRQGGS